MLKKTKGEIDIENLRINVSFKIKKNGTIEKTTDKISTTAFLSKRDKKRNSTNKNKYMEKSLL